MFEVTARINIREGEIDGFRRQAAEIMRQSRTKDTHPLRYDWYLSDDGMECEVRETYPNADAVVAHQRAVGEAKIELFRDFAAGHTMTLYGKPSPALAGVLEAMGVTYTQFSLFQGLKAEALEEVPA